MSDLIKINYETEQSTVSARDLHERLNIEKRFSAWFETNSKGFIESEDFISVLAGKRDFLNGCLIKRSGTDWNMPTQRSMEKELFEVKESTVNNPDGSVRINRTTRVKGKGQQYFIDKFLKDRVA